MNIRIVMTRFIVMGLNVFGTSSFKPGSFISNVPRIPVIREPTLPFKQPPFLPPGMQPSFLREAELKHSRLAMVSVLVFPVLEHYSSGLGIDAFQQLPDLAQLGAVQLMFLSEFTSMIRGWRNPLEAPFTLNENYQPGDLGFGLWNSSMGDMMDKELNNGRLAMVAMLGMMAQELVTHQRLF
jgi:hypothetical protein